MKKKHLLATTFVAAVMAIGYNMYETRQKVVLTESELENAEALATGEGATPCGGPKVNGECKSMNTINCKDTSNCD